MRSRSRLIAVAASMLVCVAMVGTGFASWVILDTKTVPATGNVTAEGVADDGITLEVTPLSDNNIIFGSPATMNNASAWLVESADSGEGRFTADFSVTIQGNVKSFTIDFKSTGDGFQTAATNNLVVGYPTYTVGSTTPTGSITKTEDIEIEQTSGKATLKFGADKTEEFEFSQRTTFHIIATFNWGSAFNNQNPYEFFNGKTQTETASDWKISAGTVGTPSEGAAGPGTPVTWADVAKGVLGWMHTNFSDVNYTVTFTAAQGAKKSA